MLRDALAVIPAEHAFPCVSVKKKTDVFPCVSVKKKRMCFRVFPGNALNESLG